jgi:membrane protease YdiL (CAAX protease family)
MNQSDLSVYSNVVPPRLRWIAGCEFMLGAFIVIGHNVFRIIPNEVPILVVLGLLSTRLWTGRWWPPGFQRPVSWSRTILIAVAAATLRIVLGEFLIDPLTSHFWPPPVAPAGAASVTGNLTNALVALLIVWTFAAFGEEFSYRGYLLPRAAAIGRGSTIAYWAAVVAVSILFGFGHYYKGPAGVVDSGMAGLILGGAYMLSGKNLWAPVLAHGLIDTFGVIVVFFGWQS